jgi:hypothetical protein
LPSASNFLILLDECISFYGFIYFLFHFIQVPRSFFFSRQEYT